MAGEPGGLIWAKREWIELKRKLGNKMTRGKSKDAFFLKIE